MRSRNGLAETFRWFLTLSLPAFVIACDEGAGAPPAAPEVSLPEKQDPLTVVSLSANLSLSEGETATGAWALSKPRAVVEDEDRTIYVLDSDWKRILVFSPQGHFLRWIGDGFGFEGGQLALPVDLAISESQLYVLDYDSRRIVVYHVDGSLQRSLRLSSLQGRELEVFADRIWLRRMFPDRDRDTWVASLSLNGRHLADHITTQIHDRPFVLSGSGGTIFRGLSGDGLWYAHANGASLSFVSTDGRVQSTVALGPVPALLDVGDGMTVPEESIYSGASVDLRSAEAVVILRSHRSAVAPEIVYHTLDFYRPDGRLIASTPTTGEGTPLSVHRSEWGDQLYVTFMGSKPRVVRYSVSGES